MRLQMDFVDFCKEAWIKRELTIPFKSQEFNQKVHREGCQGNNSSNIEKNKA